MREGQTPSAQRPAAVEIRDLRIDYRNLHRFTIQQMIKNPAFKGGEVIHAVRGVDLTVREGEILGIIGENGAGKSTLLKAVAGIFRPDAGSIDTGGRRVSLMSLGVGFRWDLSGRENIMLAGLLLRYPAAYVRDKMREIIDFSELGSAIDRPVRTYSDGMYAKLSFAITAVLETDIMLIDELLSVGDEQFQNKSYRKIQGLVHQENMTGIIVSHDMDLVRNTCTRAVWMHNGRIQASGAPDEIVDMYVRWSEAGEARKLAVRDGAAGEADGIRMFRGLEIREKSGVLSGGAEGQEPSLCAAVNWEPLFLAAGSVVRLRSDAYVFRVFRYTPKAEREWIYTAAVQPEGCWMRFDPDASDPFWRSGQIFEMPEDGWVRLLIRRKDGQALPERQDLEDFFIVGGNGAAPEGYVFEDELEKTAAEIAAVREPGDAVLCVLTDSHAVFGGTWADTAANIRALAGRVRPDAVIHMGDLTDGLFPETVSDRAVRGMIRDLEKTGAPVLVCIGNHDLARYPGAAREQDPCAFARKHLGQEKPYRFFDLEEKKLRLILLSSFDPRESEPYGFSEEELRWLKKCLSETPEDHGVLVFSHIFPGRERTRWGEPVRNGKEVMDLLRAFDRERSGALLGLFYGHEHRDRTETGEPFPVVGISCSRLEDKDTLPMHGGVFSRVPGTASQELWDAAVVKREEKRTELVRFGFGENRSVRHG